MAFGFMDGSDRKRVNEICDLTDDIINIIVSEGDIKIFEEKVGKLAEKKASEAFFDQRYFWLIFFTVMNCGKEEYSKALKKVLSKEDYKALIEYCMTSYSVFNGYIFYNQLFSGDSDTKKEMIMDFAEYEKEKSSLSDGWGVEASEEMSARTFLSLKYSLIKFGNGDMIRKFFSCFENKSPKEISIYLYLAAKQRNKEIMRALFEMGLRFSTFSDGFLMLLLKQRECTEEFLLPNFGKYLIKNYDPKKEYTYESFIKECVEELDDSERFRLLSTMYNYFEEEDFKKIKKYLPKIKRIVDLEENHFYNDWIYDLTRYDFIKMCDGCFDENELYVKICDESVLSNIFITAFDKENIKGLSKKITIDISINQSFECIKTQNLIEMMNDYTIVDENEGLTLFVMDIISRNSKRAISTAFNKGFINKENFKDALSFAASKKKIKSLTALSALTDKILDNNSAI